MKLTIAEVAAAKAALLREESAGLPAPAVEVAATTLAERDATRAETEAATEER